ncbi:MAG TPA: hypothetical protein PK447_02890 [Ignavibacteria bacterium]|nr:hypothetical protein [Ignavibacteria bacterium]
MNKIIRNKAPNINAKMIASSRFIAMGNKFDRHSSFLINRDDKFEKISNDLRDGINQKLYAVKLKLENAIFKLKNNKANKSANDEILQANEFLSEAISGIMSISVDYNPATGTGIDLKNYIESLCVKFSQIGRKKFILSGFYITGDIPKPTALILYNIIYEVFCFILTSAKVHQVSVELRMADNFIHLKIKSDTKNLFSIEKQYTKNETLQKVSLLYILKKVCAIKGITCQTQRNESQLNILIPVNET